MTGPTMTPETPPRPVSDLLSQPATLSHDGIAQRIPHQGRMCLLDQMLHWTDRQIECSATSHTAADNPLRSARGLLAPCAIEYAAQAMALHGALTAPAGVRASPGYLASVREVRLSVLRLDDIAGALQVRAQRLAGDASLVSYAFSVADASGRLLADGRASVVLNSPLRRAK